MTQETQDPKDPKSNAEHHDSDSRIPVVSERRKKALVCYLAGLFGIAFLLVLGSLMINGGQSADDAARIQTLETRVQTLERQVKSLTRQNEDLTGENDGYVQQIGELEKQMLEMAQSAEAIESNAALSQAEADMLRHRSEAASLLITAQDALIRSDRKALDAALEALEEHYDALDEAAKQSYISILEKMDLPVPGKGN